MNNELYHFGVKGMRWGVRRYQNEDGSLTELGRRRLGQDSSIHTVSRDDRTYIDDSDPASSRKAHTKIRTEISGDNMQLSKLQRSGSDSSRIASDLFKRSADRGRAAKANKIDLSEMSDQELRTRVNRLNMERQYKNLTTENVRMGRERVSEALRDIGDLIALGANVASAAASIALILK